MENVTSTDVLFKLKNLTTTNYTETDKSEHPTSNWVWMVGSPIVIMVGTFGNIVSILVLSRKTMRNSSTSVYLTILAFTDLIALYSGLLRSWILVVADVDVRHTSEMSCKIHIYLVYLSLQYSAWLLVLVTLERCISITSCCRLKVCCSQNGRVSVSLFVFVILACLNSHFFYGLGDANNERNETLHCVPVTSAYHEFDGNVWPWIDLAFFCLIPFFILFIGNGLIIISILKIQNAINKFNNLGSIRQRKTASATKTLLLLNLVFFITTSPSSIYLIGEKYWSTEDPHEYEIQEIAWACVNILGYCNNALNFFMYCLSGRKFKRELFMMVGIGKGLSVRNVYSTEIPGRTVHKNEVTNRNLQSVTPASEITEHM